MTQLSAFGPILVSPMPQTWWPLAWQWVSEAARLTTDDAGPKVLEEFFELRRARDNELTWGIQVGGVPVGYVAFTHDLPWLGTLHICTGRRAVRRGLLDQIAEPIAHDIFATGVEKVMAPMFADNRAAYLMARRIGFVQEGVFRQHAKRNGILVDVRVLAMTQSDWRARGRVH